MTHPKKAREGPKPAAKVGARVSIKAPTKKAHKIVRAQAVRKKSHERNSKKREQRKALNQKRAEVGQRAKRGLSTGVERPSKGSKLAKHEKLLARLGMNRVRLSSNPLGIPAHYQRKETRNRDGYEWVNPKNKGDRIRFMLAKPHASGEGSRYHSVRHQISGHRYSAMGEQAKKKSKESHIRLDSYNFKAVEKNRIKNARKK